jgi:hypothetical protein
VRPLPRAADVAAIRDLVREEIPHAVDPSKRRRQHERRAAAFAAHATLRPVLAGDRASPAGTAPPRCSRTTCSGSDDSCRPSASARQRNCGTGDTENSWFGYSCSVVGAHRSSEQAACRFLCAEMLRFLRRSHRGRGAMSSVQHIWITKRVGTGMRDQGSVRSTEVRIDSVIREVIMALRNQQLQ